MLQRLAQNGVKGHVMPRDLLLDPIFRPKNFLCKNKNPQSDICFKKTTYFKKTTKNTSICESEPKVSLGTPPVDGVYSRSRPSAFARAISAAVPSTFQSLPTCHSARFPEIQRFSINSSTQVIARKKSVKNEVSHTGNVPTLVPQEMALHHKMKEKNWKPSFRWAPIQPRAERARPRKQTSPI